LLTTCFPILFRITFSSIGSHPFDKFADRTDDEIKEAVLQVGCDKDNHMALMNELVFDERIEGLSDSCIELMRHLMHPDPEKRMTSEKFLRHPWIQGLTASWTTMGKTHDELKAFWQNRFRAEIMKKFAARFGISGDTLSDNDMTKIFGALDLKHNGVLDLEAIQTVFRDIGISDKNIDTIFACADLDGSGVIRFDEFRVLMSKSVGDGPGLHVDYLQQRFKSHITNRFLDTQKGVPSDKNKLREIFNAIDLEGNGVLDPHDIRVFLRSVGEPEDIISRIVASLDLNRNGRVSWEQFLALMSMEGK
jgi:Ca2+-binding EF-hand superfamily protein